jgi:Raf kinase inhibitor-like YbhB/YbcL family protein
MTGCSPEDKQACDTFPTEATNYGTGDMKHISPELVFNSVPAGTQSFAVVLRDLSFQNGFVHWVIWNIPGSATGLAENIPGGAMPSTPAGASQASIDTTGHYFGPGAVCNVYEFVVYALNQATITPPSTTDRPAIQTYIEGLGDAILGEASIRARSDEGACN